MVRPRRMLAALTTGDGAPVPDSTPAELVLDEESGADIQNTIRVVVRRLRCALGAHGRKFAQRTPGGYRLTLAADNIDHRRFAASVAIGTRALAAGPAGWSTPNGESVWLPRPPGCAASRHGGQRC
ncbi:hypothetical protein [Nocardia sp. NPDC051463]|uniref:AfsR/SARP family transcriptional regulator n=1 Tax=Nocardia sp. NPDC051463 TaxID=3154845 RepID=UPI0034191BBC